MPKQVGLFYGTQTGNTETVAEAIRDQLGEAVVELHDVADASVDDLAEYEYLIIGCPTWNLGDLQADWENLYPDLDDADFSGKTVAYFGCGDQVGYSENFMDAPGMLEEKIAERGGKTVGMWSTAGYEYDESKAVRGDKFVGLAIDEDNQSDLTDDRISAWVSQVRQEMGL
ncbi:flavodoxin FldA [filamentous cyanobacterium LEGE 11480]|uniref:Flavodoxin n=1 Tax=Romeriopsis navalis LEGE 11480 TaxID=2777977 RepID=A0A928VRS4_9CYAN|nr:flavodoxin FldA [Romeriopsis navalis]MBE9031390.1 flavodoxin FldA [Romeriopsis navalis LEGE 11480]